MVVLYSSQYGTRQSLPKRNLPGLGHGVAHASLPFASAKAPNALLAEDLPLGHGIAPAADISNELLDFCALATQPTGTPEKRTVLVADDDAIVRTVASDLVTSWGYDCVAVADGDAALRCLQQDHPPTIAILDWLMPRLTGTEICARVRAANPRQYIYFILLSARDAKEDTIAGLRSGADAYMSKPLDAAEFHAKLEIADRILLMEESLRDLHAATELFVNSVPSILVGTDKSARITRWNQEAEQVFGVDPAHALGHRVAEVGVIWSSIETWQQVEDVIETGTAARLNVAFDRRGMQRLAGLTIHPLRDHVGNIAGSVIIGSDITEKR